MTRDKLTEIVEQALREALGPAALDRVEVAEGMDHDGEDALFVTVRYRPGLDPIDPTKAQGLVRDRLLAAAEKRFPYMNYIYPDDPLAEDDKAADVRSAS